MTPDVASMPAQGEFITFDAVHLDVVDLDRSVAWWADVAGLPVVAEHDNSVDLGIDSETLVVLRASALVPVARGYGGLYHLAINLPSERAFAQTLARLLATGQRIGTTDHVVAESIYLTDPDGIGLELTFETPERVRSIDWPETAREPEIIDVHGRPRRGLERLDVERVLRELPEEAVPGSLPAGTKVGHLHLKVSDLGAAYAFYRDGLGFRPINYVPVIGYGDLGTGARLTHRIAVNTWDGAGLPPRPPGMAGMDHFTLRYESREHLRAVVDGLEDVERRADRAVVRDPAGNRIHLWSCD